MPNYVYVAAQDDNQIAVFTIDGETGRLTRTAEVPMPGGPSLLAIRPDRQWGIHLRQDTVIPQWFQASKAAAASDRHAVHC